MLNEDGREVHIQAEAGLISFDDIQALAMEIMHLMDGKPIPLIQTALVLGWVHTTGILHDFPPEERVERASVMVQRATAAVAKEVQKGAEMTRKEVEIALAVMGDGSGVRPS